MGTSLSWVGRFSWELPLEGQGIGGVATAVTVQ